MSSLHPRHNRAARRLEALFRGVCIGAAALPLLLLLGLVADTVLRGLPKLEWDFLTGFPSRKWERAGLLPGLVGSVQLILLTAGLALPVGIGAAVYLEEYGSRTNRIARFIEINIANLAGVPSILYGLLGLEVFVRALGLGRSLLAGAATLALLVLPVVILTTREALRTVPDSLREAAAALGATRWQVTRQVVLPMALPGILTGAILAVSRAMGETAPLVVIGALTFMTYVPDGVDSYFTALPILIFNWTSRPNPGFATTAAAGITVLLVTLLALNLFAIVLRGRLMARRQGSP
jgi:phosphate transport system permease protein